MYVPVSPTDEPPESILDYHSMPALSDLDDFDLCLKEPEAVYCIVDLELLEDETPLYQFIKVRSFFNMRESSWTAPWRCVRMD